MSITIAIANQKGGVGKTTSTYNLGTGLALKGKKVLLVDLDSQANLTISAGLEPLEIEKNINNVLRERGTDPEECIQKINTNLDMLTSSTELASLETELLVRDERDKVLDKALEPVKALYDFILIDCPPQLSILTINALTCANQVIIPVKTDYLPFRGLELLMSTIQAVQEITNHNLSVYGIIATIYEKRCRDDNDILKALQEQYNLIGVVKKMVSVKRCIYDGKAVIECEPKNEVSIVYSQIVDRIIAEQEKED